MQPYKMFNSCFNAAGSILLSGKTRVMKNDPCFRKQKLKPVLSDWIGILLGQNETGELQWENTTIDIFPLPLVSHDSGGEEAKILQRKAGAACSLFCFHIRRRRQANSPSVGLRRALADDWWKWKPPAPPPTGRSSLLAHVVRPESTHAQIPHTQTQTQTQNLGIPSLTTLWDQRAHMPIAQIPLTSISKV